MTTRKIITLVLILLLILLGLACLWTVTASWLWFGFECLGCAGLSWLIIAVAIAPEVEG